MSASKTRNERLLVELSKLPGNDICADCRSPAPRWCSWNLGIFLCVSCASVHRKMGTHISRVKSLTLDTFTREQVDTIRDIGNIKSNLKINNDDSRNPPPTNLEHGERDNELERYIRRKYDPSLSKPSIVQAAFRRNMAQSSPIPATSSLALHTNHQSSRAHQNNVEVSPPPPSLPVRTPSQAPSSSLPPTEPTRTPVFGNMLEHRPTNGQGAGHPGGVEPMRRGRVAPNQATTSPSASQTLQYAVPPASQQQQSSYQTQPPLQYATQPTFQYTASQQGDQHSGVQSFSSHQNSQQQQQQFSYQSQPQSAPPQPPYQSYGGWFDLRSTNNGPTEFLPNQYTQSQPTPSSSSNYGSLSAGGSYGTQGSFSTGVESNQYPSFQLQQQQQSQTHAQPPQQSTYGSFSSSNAFPPFQQQQSGPSSISSYSFSNGMDGASMSSQNAGLYQAQSQSQGQFANGSSGQSTSMMGQGQMQMQGQVQGQGFGTQNGFMMGMMPSRPGAGWRA